MNMSESKKFRLNQSHPDCAEYTRRFWAIANAQSQEWDAINAAGRAKYPDWQGKDSPWERELVECSRKYNAQIKELQEEYAYLFTEEVEDESGAE